jgi:uncharacterized protein
VTRAFAELLEVQDRDLAADQLRHRRETLPERAQLEAARTRLVAIDAGLAQLDGRLGELERTQTLLEADIASVNEHMTAENQKLYGGAVTAPRELEALQSEVTGLGRRRDELEERLLEVMEEADEPSTEAARLRQERDDVTAAIGQHRDALAAAESVIDAELTANDDARRTHAADLPADLLDRYDALRRKLGGIGAARLEGGRCTGCHLSLPATEIDAVKRAPADALITHEECGRILVR